VFVEGTVIVAYLNDEIALSVRGYEHRTGDFGIFVAEGGASFSRTGLKVAVE